MIILILVALSILVHTEGHSTLIDEHISHISILTEHLISCKDIK